LRKRGVFNSRIFSWREDQQRILDLIHRQQNDTSIVLSEDDEMEIGKALSTDPILKIISNLVKI
jgi:hypothetical protein